MMPDRPLETLSLTISKITHSLYLLLRPIHTADADETKLSSLVASAVCTRIRN